MTSGLDARIVLQREEGFHLDVDFSAEHGEVVALLGPNGAGKSTIVDVLAGLTAIDAGHVALDDVVLDDPNAGVFVSAEHRRLGVVFQENLLFSHMTVRSNVEFGLRELTGDDTSSEVDRWMLDLGLVDLADSRPAALSGGEARRVALARAMVRSPKLLVLDEPLAPLDVGARADTRRLIADALSRFAGPALVITHDPAEAALLADRVVVIEDGRVTHDGAFEDLRLRPTTAYAADLGGVNLAVGRADAGVVDVEGHELVVSDAELSGKVVVSFHPRTVGVHRTRPQGSARNAWQATVERVESFGSTVRIQVGQPMALTAEITPQSADALGIEQGTPVWLSLKATEIRTDPAAPETQSGV